MNNVNVKRLNLLLRNMNLLMLTLQRV